MRSAMRAASQLPLHMHVNLKSDYDDYDRGPMAQVLIFLESTQEQIYSIRNICV